MVLFFNPLDESGGFYLRGDRLCVADKSGAFFCKFVAGRRAQVLYSSIETHLFKTKSDAHEAPLCW